MTLGHLFFPKTMGTCSYVRIMAVGIDYRLPITDYVKQTSDYHYRWRQTNGGLPIIISFFIPLHMMVYKLAKIGTIVDLAIIDYRLCKTNFWFPITTYVPITDSRLGQTVGSLLITDRQEGKQTDRQTESWTERQVDRQTGGQTDRQTDIQTGGQTDRQEAGTETDSRTDRQTAIRTDRQIREPTGR